MPSVETIRQLTVQGKSVGLDKLNADLKAVSNAQDSVAQSNIRLVSSNTSAERSVLSASRQFQNLTRSVDPVAKANAALERSLRVVENAIKQGTASAADAARTTAILNLRHAEAIEKAREMEQALNGHSKALGLNRNQMMESVHVLKSLADQMLAGQDPIRALSVEGGRIAQIFTEGKGGVGGTLSAVKTTIGGMISPLGVATAGVAAMGAAGALAFAQWEAGQEKLEASLNGLGRASGLTRDGLESVAEAGARFGGIHPSDARDLASGYNATGRIDGGMNQSLVGLSKNYAMETGQSLADSGKDLAKAFADPAKGADLLNEKLGTLDVGTRDLIKSQAAQLDILGAQHSLYNAVSNSVEGVTDRTWKLTKAAQAAVDVYQHTRDLVGSTVAGVVLAKTPQEQLDQTNRRIAASQGYQHSPLLNALGLDQNPLGGLYADRDGQAKAIYAQHRLELQQANQIRASALADPAADILKSAMPDSENRRALTDEIGALKAVQENADAMKALGARAGEVGPAIALLTSKLGAMLTPLQQMTVDGDLAARSALARTAAEKLAVDAEKARNTALEQGKGDLVASQAAENARNLALAEGTRAALDNLRASTDRAALSGLSPFDRMLQENRQQLRDMNEKTLTSPSASTGPGFGGALAFTLRAEGGLNPHDTNGTPSNFGINQSANPGIDVTKLDAGGASSIYKRNYWGKIGADSMSPQMAKVAFDTAVMEGVGQAMKLVGQSGGDANKLLDLRQGFEGNLLASNPEKYGPYRIAWANRDAGLRSDISGVGGSGGYVNGIPPDNAAGSPAGAGLISSLNESAARTNSLTGAQDLLFPGIERTNQQLKAEAALLDVQASAVGGSTAALAGAVERQKEWNEVNASGATQLKLINTFGAEGATMWSNLTDKINANADAAAALAKKHDDLQRVTAALDDVRSATRDGMGTLLTDLEQGKSLGRSLGDVMEQLGQKIQSAGLDLLTDSLFGKQGQSNGGLFGGGLGSIFGSLLHMGGSSADGGIASMTPLGAGGIGRNADGTDDWRGGPSWVGERGPEIVNLPRHAQVIPNGATMAGGNATTVHIGGPTIHVAGDVSEKNMAMIRSAVADGQQQTINHIQRHLNTMNAAANKRYGA